MRTESVIALIMLAAIAVLAAASMVETYWQCRLLQSKSCNDCMPPAGGSIPGI